MNTTFTATIKKNMLPTPMVPLCHPFEHENHGINQYQIYHVLVSSLCEPNGEPNGPPNE
jgi:hypothetical protein